MRVSLGTDHAGFYLKEVPRGEMVGPELAWEITEAFLSAEFSGEERHLRRLEKVDELDKSRR